MRYAFSPGTSASGVFAHTRPAHRRRRLHGYRRSGVPAVARPQRPRAHADYLSMAPACPLRWSTRLPTCALMKDEGGYRIAADHAQDLGKLIEELRARTKAPVWIAIGRSRGSLSAVNAAARLSALQRPTATILLSGDVCRSDAKARAAPGLRTRYFSPTSTRSGFPCSFGHAADNHARLPPDQMKDVIAKTHGLRQQAATLTGGPVETGRTTSIATRSARSRRASHRLYQSGSRNRGRHRCCRFMRGGSY